MTASEDVPDVGGRLDASPVAGAAVGGPLLRREVALWRCTACDKWSHAKRRPQVHHRFVVADDAAEDEIEPAGTYETQPSSYGNGFDDSFHPGGWWVHCGPFAEWSASPVAASLRGVSEDER